MYIIIKMFNINTIIEKRYNMIKKECINLCVYI